MAILAELGFPAAKRFCVVRSDLLAEPVEAIVNAANGHLAHGGGIAAIISRAAGPELQAESDRLVRERGPFAPGSAVVTTAGRLAFKGVIHAVGPRQGEGDEERKLIRALESAFTRAHEAGWSSLSFPAVSSGIFAVPLALCARAYLAAATRWLAANPDSPLCQLRLCLRDQPIIDAVLEEVPRWK